MKLQFRRDRLGYAIASVASGCQGAKMAGDKEIQERYTCMGCGHEHDERPGENICLNCGKPRVVDLLEPGQEDLDALAHALEDRNPNWTPRNLLIAGGVLAVTCILVYLVNDLLVKRSNETRTCVSYLRSSTNAVHPPDLLSIYGERVRGPLLGCLKSEQPTNASFNIHWRVQQDGRVITRNVGDAPGARRCITEALNKIEVLIPPPGAIRAELNAKICHGIESHLEILRH